MKKINSLQKYSPVILRISISLLFLWFGLTQILNPDYLISYLPDFLLAKDSPLTFVILNGILETVLGLFLLLGLFTRPISLILALHLLGIAITLGYNDIAIRDYALVLATFSVFLHGKDPLCLDNKIFKG